MSALEAAKSDELIQGKCIISETLLNALYDSGASYSFISLDCVRHLRLSISLLTLDIVVSTPTNNPVTTSQACLKCPISIDGRKFFVDLICLPLFQLDIILGMD